jgi:hypothetical protein
MFGWWKIFETNTSNGDLTPKPFGFVSLLSAHLRKRAGIGHLAQILREKAKAEAKIQQLLQQRAKRYVPLYSVALVFAGLRETETALQWLEQAFEDRDVHMLFLLDHKCNGLRSNEQFRQILCASGSPFPREARKLGTDVVSVITLAIVSG